MSDLVVRRWRLSYRRQVPAGDGQDVQKRRLEIARSRLFMTAGVFLLCFGVLAVRTLNMAVVGPADAHARDADGAGSTQIARADIVDRNGSLLASSLPTHSLFMEPWSMIDPEESALALAAALPDLDPDRLLRLATSGKKFAWVRRNLTPEQVHAVNRLGIPGLGFRSTLR